VETALIQLWSSSTSLGRDFVLDIATRHDGENEAPQAWMEEHPTLPSQRALMVTLPPKVLGQAGHRGTAADGKGEVIFLADQSGSMSDKIRSLKSAMQFFLKGILLGTKFNIWSLGSRYRSWCPRSVDYDEASLDAALAYVDKTFDADLGGTELFPAIQAVVAARDKARMTNVIVLTDGQTWRLDATLVFIQQTRVRNKGRVRFFSLSIGDGVLHARVEGIAKAGGSYAEVIPSSVRDGVGGPRCLDAAGLPLDRPPQPAVLELFRKPQPTWHRDVSQAPLPRVLAALPKKSTTIHKLAARPLLHGLERGPSHLHLGQSGAYRGIWAETSLIKREAEAIACRWGLVSKWTSFFLREE